jgi:hypothetical protein
MSENITNNSQTITTPILIGENWRDKDGRLLAGHPALPGVGRPKGSVSITEAIKKKLMEEYLDPDAPMAEKKLYLEKIIDAIFHNAIKNRDQRALKNIWAYVDGMPKGSFDMGVDREGLAELTDFMRALAKPNNSL